MLNGLDQKEAFLALDKRIRTLKAIVDCNELTNDTTNSPFINTNTNTEIRDQITALISGTPPPNHTADESNIGAQLGRLCEKHKQVYTDTEPVWVDFVLRGMSEKSSHVERTQYLGRVMKSLMRGNLASLDDKVKQLKVCLDSCNTGDLLLEIAKTEEKKAFLLENEESLLKIARDCQRFEELQGADGILTNFPASSTIDKMTKTVIRLDSKSAALADRVNLLDKRVMDLVLKVSRANELFTILLVRVKSGQKIL